MILRLHRVLSLGFRVNHQLNRFVTKSEGKTMLTGLQPTGTPHLGNYLGVIRPIKKIQSSRVVETLLVTVADLHALTSADTDLVSGISELSSALMACLIPEEDRLSDAVRPIIFLQSAVRGHTELAWILSSCCSLPRLAHLPQWRDKSQSASLKTFLESSAPETSKTMDPTDRASVGLFTYPVLQAADILLYDAHLVPVGADQTAHIELARDLVRSATNRWPSLKPLLSVPKSLTLGVPKIHSLRNPSKKMSKSDASPDGAILLTDSPDTIQNKIRRAQTDSLRGVTYDVIERPGVSNLLRILAAVENRELENVVAEAGNWTKEELKSHVIDALVNELKPIGERIVELKESVQGRSAIEQQLNEGALKAGEIASARLAQIYSAIGCTSVTNSIPGVNPWKNFRLVVK